MSRALLKICVLAILTTGGWVGMWSYEREHSHSDLNDARQKAVQARAEATELQQVIRRLESGTRRAEVLVTDQSETDGALHTTLLFQEYASDGSAVPPQRIILAGTSARVEAMVIQFQGPFVKDFREPLRGKSLALFTRILGDKEAPEAGHVIDAPGHIPAIYRGTDPVVGQVEHKLWRDFWRLAEDRGYRSRMDVQVATGQSALTPFEMGRLYTLTLQADASVTTSSAPLKGIYIEMLKRNKK